MTDQILTATTEKISESLAVVTAVGELDRGSTGILGGAVDATDAVRIVVDLSGVTFCDSAALNYLVQLHLRLTGQDGVLAVAGSQSFVLRTLRVTNLERLFPVHATVAQAVEALSS
ncbi:STAS domain-containing protein [Actinoplanes sp. DH11]|uniref:STAS domain-containing protein n=1 Tax=Actinoplanes sp. DH11 TaxID=2857011 RepID=UPI001E53BDE3|nr:STAS domain-containing protein [Actinoplanes sp. DH11]